MAVQLPDDGRRRRQKNMIYSLLFTLMFLWTIKLSFPQHTAITIYSSASYTWPLGESPKNTTVEPPAPIKPSGDFISLYNGTIQDKVAIIIEDRPKTNLVPLILHFSTVLGPTWPVLIYTSLENLPHFQTSSPLRRFLAAGVIQIRLLPSSVLFTSSEDLSRFLTSPWIWEQLAPATHVLLFQSDSMLCSNAARSVEDFFGYDFVGAPIRKELGDGMNGGLSLRKRETMERITREFDWDKTGQGSRRFEDKWFWDRMHDIKRREEKDPYKRPENYTEIRIPDQEVARMFSVESIDFPHPLGVHQVGRFLTPGKTMKSLDEWCPEYKLCSSDRLT